jgi:hypothetical protein
LKKFAARLTKAGSEPKRLCAKKIPSDQLGIFLIMPALISLTATAEIVAGFYQSLERIRLARVFCAYLDLDAFFRLFRTEVELVTERFQVHAATFIHKYPPPFILSLFKCI